MFSNLDLLLAPPFAIPVPTIAETTGKQGKDYLDLAVALTAENVATDFKVSRADQDLFGLRSQEKTAKAQADGSFAQEPCPVEIAQKKGDPTRVDRDEHPRLTAPETLAKLKPIVRPGGTVTAGNASGVNDGARALIVAREEAVILLACMLV